MIRPHECRRESLQAHDDSQHTESPGGTRPRGSQDDDEPHGNTKSGGRIESRGRREVQASNLGPALRRDESSNADDDAEKRDQ